MLNVVISDPSKAAQLRCLLIISIETDIIPKRSRLTSRGDSVPGPSQDSPELPEGLPEVVRKGFNDIPNVPITSPFILRRTTALSKTRPGVTRKQHARSVRTTQIPKPFTRDATVN